MNLVFLDFDGVLNTPGTWGLQPLESEAIEPALVARLSSFVEEHDARIVVSSSWRYEFDVEAFQLMLGAKGLATPQRVIACTPHGEMDVRRGAEVLDWLRHHENMGDAFVILDDMGLDSFEGLGRYLVQVNGAIGLSDTDVRLAAMVLDRQRR